MDIVIFVAVVKAVGEANWGQKLGKLIKDERLGNG
jgi:hypothetical protein